MSYTFLFRQLTVMVTLFVLIPLTLSATSDSATGKPSPDIVMGKPSLDIVMGKPNPDIVIGKTNTGSVTSKTKPGFAFAKTLENSCGSDKPAISAADLRLSPILPGPRYIIQNDLNPGNRNSGFMSALSNSPGYAFMASAIVPGLGQAANRQWWKTALFVAVEATAIGVYIHRENRGRDGERYYESYAHDHWSVVKYARYITEEHELVRHDYEFRDLLTEQGRAKYDHYRERYGDDFDVVNDWSIFDTHHDWPLIDIDILRDAERRSLYENNNPFSHDLPDYGSQQYYELISKYFQFGPGWRKWDSNIHNIDQAIMPEDFWYHAQIGYDFNDDLGVARNMLTLLVANHFVSAFDAYFTQKLRNARIQPSASMAYGVRPTFGLAYRF